MTAEHPPRRWTWRFATPGDAPALVALVRAAYRGSDGWTSEAHLVAGDRTDPASVLELLRRARVLVVEDAGTLIACCRLEEARRGVVGLGMFAVLPRLQGAGLGRWLIGQAARVAAEQFRAEALEISVLAQQTALLAWYERLGFVRTGETRPFPADARFAQPQREGLFFVVLRKPVNAADESE